YPGVHIYRARPDHSLALLGSVDFKDSTPDNIFVDPLTGQLYCASFLRALEVFRYFKHPSLNTTTTASTKIVRLTQRKDLSNGGFDIESILIDSGRLMPTATIAAIQRRNNVKRLLVGCVMCDAVVACDDANLIELSCVPQQLLAARGVRCYSDDKLFKGVPKFTRVQPKGSRKVVPVGTNEAASESPELDTGSRFELNARNLGRMALIGGAAVTCVGLVGVATYYAATYFYLKNHWPVPTDVDNGTARNLLYKATYYEHLSPDHERALSALERALELLVVREGASPDSVTVADIKVRIAACLSGL
ncbi:hypothetical protein GGI21_006223, partial [Coemansia aciculifera]